MLLREMAKAKYTLFPVLILVSANLIFAAPQYSSKPLRMRKFPEHVKFGVATAAYQIEGGWNAADKSPSIWDVFVRKPGTIKDNTTGDDACLSYYYYKRDIKMMKFLDVDFYRFSISWARILPTGLNNKISEAGKEYYNNLINDLLKNGIEPIATIYHWDLPQSLQDLGGWTSPNIVDWFGEYARVLYQLFGDRVKTWITLNEPKQFGVFGYGTTRFAPGIDSKGIGEYLAIKNLLLAHARAWHIYNDEFRPIQKGKWGITIATDFREGATNSPEDVEAGEIAMDFEVGLYSHPIFSTEGGYPPRVIHRVAQRSKEQGYHKSRLPELSLEEIKYIRGTSDFYGFNHYSTRFYTTENYNKGTFPVPSYDDDVGSIGTYLDYEKGAVLHTSVVPKGIRKALKWVKDTCNDPPIMITENGFGTFKGLNDSRRINYFIKYLDSILDSIELDKCNIVSYTAWSLMDNFEWDSGLTIKFGLFETEYESKEKTRRARDSAFWYRHLLATRTLDPNYIVKRDDVAF